MHALAIIVPALIILWLAYRYYSAFIAARVWALDDSRVTPAHRKYDGANFYPTTRWVLFGHHFAAIAGAGPLVGPVLAAQFGYAPGLLWLIAGVCLAGAVQDSFWLWASTRRGGRSLADIARSDVSPLAGVTAAVAIYFILVIAMAGLGLAVVNALAESAWGTFTIFITIPLAVLMGFHMFRWRKGHVREATIVGVIVMGLAVIFGKNVAGSSIGSWFLLTKHQITIAMALYTIAASILPVWMLLTPRAYLSTFMKIGTIAFLVIGVMILNPKLEAPAISQYVGGGGPIIPGPLFPFLFITIACGAISGFHAIVASGTTSKMVDKESDIRPIGYGAMLIEGLVGIVAMITATALHPGDYFAINTTPQVFATLGIPMVNLQELQAEVGEIVIGRPGGAVSLAVGMAQIFSGLPGMRSLMAYWYHFAIMFEAVFILTTIDSGTRIGRFLFQEFVGRVWKPFARPDFLPASVFDGSDRRLLGLLHLDGRHQHRVADVRRCKPAARGRRARRGDDDRHQRRPREVRLGHRRTVRPRDDHDAQRRLPEHHRQLLADDDQPRRAPPRAGLRELDLYGHHDGVRRDHPRGHREALAARSHRPRRASARDRRGLIDEFEGPPYYVRSDDCVCVGAATGRQRRRTQ